MGQKLLHGLDVIGGGLKFAIRTSFDPQPLTHTRLFCQQLKLLPWVWPAGRAAQKQVVANDKADLLTVPRPPRPHVKRYLRELRTLYPDNAWTAPTASGLSAEGREGDTAREHGETGGMDARLKVWARLSVHSLNQCWPCPA